MGKEGFGEVVVVMVMILVGRGQEVGELGIGVVIGKRGLVGEGSGVGEEVGGGGVMVVLVLG